MNVYSIDPLQDARWAELLARHPLASVFDSPGWLRALRQTYGYDPFVLTTSPPGTELENGLALCRVKTWLGGRLVSLPFSDHCEPLVDRPEELSEILSFLTQEVGRGKWKYAEVRPRGSAPAAADGNAGNFQAMPAYCFHSLDLRPSLEELFRRFHPSCVQRVIRRAEREELAYEEGTSEALLAKFYHLLRLTRQRHGMPPQPLAWFRNLVGCLGEHLTVRVALKDGQPIASILTLSFKKTMVYKYGCSDARYHKLGGMPFLFWKTIQQAKEMALEEFDLGRSDADNSGLIAFKDRLGASRSTLTYYRYSGNGARQAADDWKLQAAKRVLEHMPAPALNVAGRLLYKYFG